MATPEQVALVRSYTGEPTADNWTDAQLDALVNELGVDGATARVWREKQARFSKLVDVAEAGASRKMSQAFEHAKQMANHWDDISGGGGASSGKTRVHQIVRE